MNVIFDPVDESYIKAKIEDGFYSNATEFVRDAVRRLREYDDAKYTRLMNARELGEQAVIKLDGQLYTHELFNEIMTDATQHVGVDSKVNLVARK